MKNGSYVSSSFHSEIKEGLESISETNSKKDEKLSLINGETLKNRESSNQQDNLKYLIKSVKNDQKIKELPKAYSLLIKYILNGLKDNKSEIKEEEQVNNSFIQLLKRAIIINKKKERKKIKDNRITIISILKNTDLSKEKEDENNHLGLQKLNSNNSSSSKSIETFKNNKNERKNKNRQKGEKYNSSIEGEYPIQKKTKRLSCFSSSSKKIVQNSRHPSLTLLKRPKNLKNSKRKSESFHKESYYNIFYDLPKSSRKNNRLITFEKNSDIYDSKNESSSGCHRKKNRATTISKINGINLGFCKNLSFKKNTYRKTKKSSSKYNKLDQKYDTLFNFSPKNQIVNADKYMNLVNLENIRKKLKESIIGIVGIESKELDELINSDNKNEKEKYKKNQTARLTNRKNVGDIIEISENQETSLKSHFRTQSSSKLLLKPEKNEKNEIILINKKKEKYRSLTIVGHLYDSLDDEEIEDEEVSNFYLHPNCIYINILDFFVLLSSIFSSLILPALIGNKIYIWGNKSVFNSLQIIFLDLINLFDLIAGFFKAYYNFDEVLIKNSQSMCYYYLDNWFLLDLICAIPSFSIIKYIELNSKNHTIFINFSNYSEIQIDNIHYLLLITKFLKVIKTYKTNIIKKKILKILTSFEFFEKWESMAIQILYTFTAINIVASIYIYLGRNCTPSWIYANRMEDESFSSLYLSSLYYLFQTVTTVGYGDFPVSSTIERIFQIIMLICGTITYSWLISSVSTYVNKINSRTACYEKKLTILNEIKFQYPKMSETLYDNITRYLRYRYFHEQKNKKVIIESLPYTLRNSLIMEMYKSIIDTFIFFKNFDNSDLISQVVLAFRPVIAIKDEILVKEGDYIEDIIFVKNGVLGLGININLDDPRESLVSYLNESNLGIKKRNISKETILTRNSSNMTLRNIGQNQYEQKSFDCKYNTLIKSVEKNENKKNVQFIKIIEIRKGEHFGDILMFLNELSPLTVKVKTIKAELFFLPKMDAIEISSNYPNIWRKINMKSLHNMIQIKKLVKKVTKIFASIHGNNIKNDKITKSNISSASIELKTKEKIKKKITKKKSINKSNSSSINNIDIIDNTNNQSPKETKEIKKQGSKKEDKNNEDEQIISFKRNNIRYHSLDRICKDNNYGIIYEMPNEENSYRPNCFFNTNIQLYNRAKKIRSNFNLNHSYSQKNTKYPFTQKIDIDKLNKEITKNTLNLSNNENLINLNDNNNNNADNRNPTSSSLLILSELKKKSNYRFSSGNEFHNFIISNQTLNKNSSQFNLNSIEEQNVNERNTNNITPFKVSEINDEIYPNEIFDISFSLNFKANKKIVSEDSLHKSLIEEKSIGKKIDNPFLNEIAFPKHNQSSKNYLNTLSTSHFSINLNPLYQNLNEITNGDYGINLKLRQKTKIFLLNECESEKLTINQEKKNNISHERNSKSFIGKNLQHKLSELNSSLDISRINRFYKRTSTEFNLDNFGMEKKKIRKTKDRKKIFKKCSHSIELKKLYYDPNKVNSHENSFEQNGFSPILFRKSTNNFCKSVRNLPQIKFNSHLNEISDKKLSSRRFDLCPTKTFYEKVKAINNNEKSSKRIFNQSNNYAKSIFQQKKKKAMLDVINQNIMNDSQNINNPQEYFTKFFMGILHNNQNDKKDGDKDEFEKDYDNTPSKDSVISRINKNKQNKIINFSDKKENLIKDIEIVSRTPQNNSRSLNHLYYPDNNI